MSGTVLKAWARVTIRPAIRPAKAAARTMRRKSGTGTLPSMAGEAVRVSDVVRRVVEGVDVGETDAEDDEGAQQGRQQDLAEGRRPRSGKACRLRPYRACRVRHDASSRDPPSRHGYERLAAGLLARGSPPRPAFPGLAQWRVGLRLAAYSCGGSAGLGPRAAPASLLVPSREPPPAGSAPDRLLSIRCTRGRGGRLSEARDRWRGSPTPTLGLDVTNSETPRRTHDRA